MTQATIDQKYKRNQMEIGIRKALIRFPKADEKAADFDTGSFPSRIKKFLEMDKGGVGHSFAFFQDAVVGKGKERDFSLFDCFMMSLALQMFHGGFEQLGAIETLQKSKDMLRNTFNKIISDYTDPRFLSTVSARPDLKGKIPTMNVDGEEMYDWGVYFVMSPAKISGLNSGYVHDVFISYRPKIVYGFQDLHKYIKTENLVNFTSIELVQFTKRLQDLVPAVPASKRGRKAASSDNTSNQTKGHE